MIIPKLTVLTPTYNCAKFLSDALSSTLQQEFQDFELIIIDDGSTDNTVDIVRRFQDDRVRYIRNPFNRGMVYSLNRGIDLARGEFIARLDADDVILGDRFSKQVKFLESNLEFGMVGSWYHTINGAGDLIGSRETSQDDETLSLLLFFQNQFAHSAVMMRSEIARALKYDKRFAYCEDHELWFRISEISKISNIQDFHLLYRWHSTNTCLQNQRQLNANLISLFSRELKKIGVAHSDDDLRTHLDVCFRLAVRNGLLPDDHFKRLGAWIERVFAAPGFKLRYSSDRLVIFKEKLLGSL